MPPFVISEDSLAQLASLLSDAIDHYFLTSRLHRTPNLAAKKMSTDDSNTRYGDTLRRIADGNHCVEPGSGIGPDHLVPLCMITNRGLAARFEQMLIDNNVVVRSQRERLCTQFFVAREKMADALQIREKLLAEQPDCKHQRFSRDFDSFFLLAPFALLAVLVTFVSPQASTFAWVGVLTTCVTTMIFLEHWHRQRRIHVGSQWSILDLFLGTAAAAINVAVWRFVL